MRVAAIFLAGALLLAACSPAGEGVSESVGSTIAVSSVSETATPTTVPPVLPAEPSTSSTMAVPLGPAFIEGLDLDVVMLLNPTVGGGDLPRLAWEATSGVTRYDVFVFDSPGDLYWSWSTPESSVFVGGVETDNQNAPGPRILLGMTWSVLGFDASGALVAQSEVRPISP